jgi:hypothetical protein
MQKAAADVLRRKPGEAALQRRHVARLDRTQQQLAPSWVARARPRWLEPGAAQNARALRGGSEVHPAGVEKSMAGIMESISIL